MAGPRVVIIGAGVVGAALADELSARGWTDITVVDQGAAARHRAARRPTRPGLVFQTNASKTMTELARYTVEKFCGLDVDGEPCFLQVGGLEVATTPERLAELHRRHGWVTAWGVEARLLDRRRVRRAAPPARPATGSSAGCYVPTDGLAKAVRAVEAQLAPGRRARRARAGPPRGARRPRRPTAGSPASSPTRASSRPTSSCAAPASGARRSPRMVGMDLPLTPLAHQLAWTGPVPALAGPDRGGGPADPAPPGRRPLLPRPLRPARHRLLRPPPDAGRPPTTSSPSTRPTVMPSVLPFTEDDFAAGLGRDPGAAARHARGQDRGGHQRPVLLHHRQPAAARRVAATSRASGSPRRSGSPTRPASAGPWPSGWSTATARPSTCTSATSTASSRTSSPRSTSWPATARTSSRSTTSSTRCSRSEDPRPLRTSPFHAAPAGARRRLPGGERLGAPAVVRGQRAPGRRPATSPRPDDWAARYWSPIVGAEAQATRERVAMYDMTALKRLEVSGRGRRRLPAAAVPPATSTSPSAR